MLKGLQEQNYLGDMAGVVAHAEKFAGDEQSDIAWRASDARWE